MKISKKIGAVALTTAITLGGATAAVAADGSDGPSGDGGRAAVIATICEHKDEIITRLTVAQTKISERIATLDQRLEEAKDAGHPRVAARIERRIERLNKLSARVAKRLENAPAWIAEHCS
jgi:hypothetical protein